MIRRWKAKLNNSGSAMLVAIVVSIVVIGFCLSLLLVSYALFESSIRKSTQVQCSELTKSISLELEQELTTPAFATHADQEAARAKYPLWFYLRENMNQENWSYYAGPDVAYHTEKYAYRYFDLDVTGGDASKYEQMAQDISVCMWWTPEDVLHPDERENAMLTIVVTCTKGDQVCSITSTYTIAYGADYTDASGDDAKCWKFTLEERK